jgi:hypothetical protein
VRYHAKQENKKAKAKTGNAMVLLSHITSICCLRGKMLKQKINSKKKAKTEKVDLLDWLLAIDVWLT